SLLSLFANPQAHAALSSDIAALRNSCGISSQGAGKIPFICFDLAGGANIAGSNVLIGKQGGQLDFISTSGYNKQGLPGDMTPAVTTTNFINSDRGLAFHSDSQMPAGILQKAGPATTANTNGAVIPGRSENGTGNNARTAMYATTRARAHD